MSLKQIFFVIVGFVFLPPIIADTSDEKFFDDNYKGISADYFFGDASLRSKYVLTCKGDEAILQTCYKHCGHSNFRCIYNQCICMDGFNKRKTPNTDLTKMLTDVLKFADILRSVMTSSADKDGDESQNELQPLEEHPALRHHIAHFCPDLEIARKCIRTCMQVGKPAFCGKDHRCYCGHRYGPQDVNKKVDLDDMHAQFRDLYEKYFGTSAMDSMKNNENGKPSSSEEKT